MKFKIGQIIKCLVTESLGVVIAIDNKDDNIVYYVVFFEKHNVYDPGGIFYENELIEVKENIEGINAILNGKLRIEIKNKLDGVGVNKL